MNARFVLENAMHRPGSTAKLRLCGLRPRRPGIRQAGKQCEPIEISWLRCDFCKIAKKGYARPQRSKWRQTCWGRSLTKPTRHDCVIISISGLMAGGAGSKGIVEEPLRSQPTHDVSIVAAELGTWR